MSKKWLLLLGAVLIFQLAFTPTSANHGGAIDSSNRQGLGTDIGIGCDQPVIVHGKGKIRRRRAEDPTSASDVVSQPSPSATTSVNNSPLSVTQALSNLFWGIAAVPLTMAKRMTVWGAGASWNVIESVAIHLWEITRNYVIPQLDVISTKIAASEFAPQQMRSALMSMHSTYSFIKLFGYLRPAA